jgi:hypothetical protein
MSDLRGTVRCCLLASVAGDGDCYSLGYSPRRGCSEGRVGRDNRQYLQPDCKRASNRCPLNLAASGSSVARSSDLFRVRECYLPLMLSYLHP